MNQAPSREPVVEKAQHEPHCPWFFTGVTAPFVVQSTASESGSPTYSSVPKCFRPLHTFWGLYPVYWDTNSLVVKSANSFTFNLYVRFWAFVVWIKSTWPLKIWKRVLSSVIPLYTLPYFVPGVAALAVLNNKEAPMHDDFMPIDVRTTLPNDLDLRGTRCCCAREDVVACVPCARPACGL